MLFKLTIYVVLALLCDGQSCSTRFCSLGVNMDPAACKNDYFWRKSSNEAEIISF